MGQLHKPIKVFLCVITALSLADTIAVVGDPISVLAPPTSFQGNGILPIVSAYQEEFGKKVKSFLEDGLFPYLAYFNDHPISPNPWTGRLYLLAESLTQELEEPELISIVQDFARSQGDVTAMGRALSMLDSKIFQKRKWKLTHYLGEENKLYVEAGPILKEIVHDKAWGEEPIYFVDNTYLSDASLARKGIGISSDDKHITLRINAARIFARDMEKILQKIFQEFPWTQEPLQWIFQDFLALDYGMRLKQVLESTLAHEWRHRYWRQSNLPIHRMDYYEQSWEETSARMAQIALSPDPFFELGETLIVLLGDFPSDMNAQANISASMQILAMSLKEITGVESGFEIPERWSESLVREHLQPTAEKLLGFLKTMEKSDAKEALRAAQEKMHRRTFFRSEEIIAKAQRFCNEPTVESADAIAFGVIDRSYWEQTMHRLIQNRRIEQNDFAVAARNFGRASQSYQRKLFQTIDPDGILGESLFVGPYAKAKSHREAMPVNLPRSLRRLSQLRAQEWFVDLLQKTTNVYPMDFVYESTDARILEVERRPEDLIAGRWIEYTPGGTLRLCVALIKAKYLNQAIREWQGRGSFVDFLLSHKVKTMGSALFTLDAGGVTWNSLEVNSQEYPKFWERSLRDQWLDALVYNFQTARDQPMRVMARDIETFSLLANRLAAQQLRPLHIDDLAGSTALRGLEILKAVPLLQESQPGTSLLIRFARTLDRWAAKNVQISKAIDIVRQRVQDTAQRQALLLSLWQKNTTQHDVDTVDGFCDMLVSRDIAQDSELAFDPTSAREVEKAEASRDAFFYQYFPHGFEITLQTSSFSHEGEVKGGVRDSTLGLAAQRTLYEPGFGGINREQLLGEVFDHVPVFYVDPDPNRPGKYLVDLNGAFYDPNIPLEIIQDYQRILQSVIDDNPKLGEFLSNGKNTEDYLDYFTLSDFQTLLSHRVHEEGDFEEPKEFIKNYVEAAMENKLLPEDDNWNTIRKYRKPMGAYLRDYRPDMPDSQRQILLAGDFAYLNRARLSDLQKQILLTHNIPKKVVLRTRASSDDWKDDDVMIVDDEAYYFDSRRPIPDASWELYPGENVILARWRGKLFMFYTSRSHTMRGVLVHQWRNCTNPANRFMKSQPENLDDVRGKLNVLLDKAIYSMDMNVVLIKDDAMEAKKKQEWNDAILRGGGYPRLRIEPEPSAPPSEITDGEVMYEKVKIVEGRSLLYAVRAMEGIRALDEWVRGHPVSTEVSARGLVREWGNNVDELVEVVLPRTDKVLFMDYHHRDLILAEIAEAIGFAYTLTLSADETGIFLRADYLHAPNKKERLNIPPEAWPRVCPVLEKLLPDFVGNTQGVIPVDYQEARARYMHQAARLNLDWDLVVSPSRSISTSRYVGRVEDRAAELGLKPRYDVHHHPREHFGMDRTDRIETLPNRQDAYEVAIQPSARDIESWAARQESLSWAEIRVLGTAANGHTSSSDVTDGLYEVGAVAGWAEELKQYVPPLLALEKDTDPQKSYFYMEKIYEIAHRIVSHGCEIYPFLIYALGRETFQDYYRRFSPEPKSASFRDIFLAHLFHIQREPAVAGMDSALKALAVMQTSTLAPPSQFPVRHEQKKLFSGQVEPSFWFGGKAARLYRALNIKAEISVNRSEDLAEAIKNLRTQKKLSEEDVVLLTYYQKPRFRDKRGKNFSRVHGIAAKLKNLLQPLVQEDIRAGHFIHQECFESNEPTPLLFESLFAVDVDIHLLLAEGVYIDPALRKALHGLAREYNEAQKIIRETYFPGYEIRTIAGNLTTVRTHMEFYDADFDFTVDEKENMDPKWLPLLGEWGLLDSKTLADTHHVVVEMGIPLPFKTFYLLLTDRWAIRGLRSTLQGVSEQLDKMARLKGRDTVNDLLFRFNGLHIRGKIRDVSRGFAAPDRFSPDAVTEFSL